MSGKLRVKLTEEQFEQLMYQFLLEQPEKTNRLIMMAARMFSAASVEHESKDRPFHSEWCAIVSRRVAALANELSRDEADFFRKPARE